MTQIAAFNALNASYKDYPYFNTPHYWGDYGLEYTGYPEFPAPNMARHLMSPLFTTPLASPPDDPYYRTHNYGPGDTWGIRTGNYVYNFSPFLNMITLPSHADAASAADSSGPTLNSVFDPPSGTAPSARTPAFPVVGNYFSHTASTPASPYPVYNWNANTPANPSFPFTGLGVDYSDSYGQFLHYMEPIMEGLMYPQGTPITASVPLALKYAPAGSYTMPPVTTENIPAWNDYAARRMQETPFFGGNPFFGRSAFSL